MLLMKSLRLLLYANSRETKTPLLHSQGNICCRHVALWVQLHNISAFTPVCTQNDRGLDIFPCIWNNLYPSYKFDPEAFTIFSISDWEFFMSVTTRYAHQTDYCILEFYIKENETNGSVKGSFSHLTKGAYPRSSVTCAKLNWDKISCPPSTPFCWRLRFVCPWRTPPWWQLDHGLLARWRSKVDGYVSSELGDNMWYWTA